MKKIFFTTFMLGALAFGATAQRNCAAHDVLQHQLQADPTLADRMAEIEHQAAAFAANNNGERVVVTIPVVVHVLYNTTAQNISDAQIASQLTVLNNDFRKLNADAALTPSVFTAADCEVQFCMAQRTPAGAATTGIVRKSTTVTSFSTNDAMKYSAQGGDDAWDATKYLNLWVCNIGGGILGYAQFPGGAAATDGVVIGYTCFGTTGTATAPFNLGRTATHEVGHWLNLRHIWGDANCGSDLVSDTPTHNAENYGCPTQPHLSSCTGTPREMTMNYMDYTDDACMYMFSAGQKTRMQALFATGGARVGLTTSLGCTPPVAGTCTAPTGLAAANITTTSATVSWIASGATSYNLQYKTSAATTWTTVSGLTTTSSNLTGLTAGTVYNFQVAAVCSATSTLTSTASTFTTTSTTTTCTDTYESNNTSATAKTIAVNTNITATIGTSTDKDYFKFTTTASAPKVKIDLTGLPADYDVKLYNSAGTQLAVSQNTGTTAEQIKYNTATAGATYTVYVYGYGGVFNASSCYTLRVSTQSANWRVGEGTAEETVLDAVSDKELDFTIAPNPASDVVNLDINTVRDENVNVMVYDLTGRQVFAQQQFIAKGNSQASINVSSFGKGMYYVRIENGTTFSVKKLLVE